MQTIQINNTELENFIKLQYGEDNQSFLEDFTKFIKTELIAHDIKKAFDEVKEFEEGTKTLNDIEDMMSRLRSGD